MKALQPRWFRSLAHMALVAGLALAGCGPPPPQPSPTETQLPAPAPPLPSAGPPSVPPAAIPASCEFPGFEAAAAANSRSLTTLTWAPFGRAEAGWATYAPLIQREIGTACPAESAGFAKALAEWRSRHGFAPAGEMNAEVFARMKGLWQEKRPFVRTSAHGVCPPPPVEAGLVQASPAESYGGKAIFLRPRALEAYRRMVAAARAESAEIRADPRNLTIFSGYRSPGYDAERCARQKNCDGISRAVCSPHRTGLALDLYVGHAPDWPPDSSSDFNRRFQSRGATYRWLVGNAHRFGFANYPFEPWHWEWTGEAP